MGGEMVNMVTSINGVIIMGNWMVIGVNKSLLVEIINPIYIYFQPDPLADGSVLTIYVLMGLVQPPTRYLFEDGQMMEPSKVNVWKRLPKKKAQKTILRHPEKRGHPVKWLLGCPWK